MAVLVLVAMLVGLGPVGSLVGLGFTAVTWVLLSRSLGRSGGHRWGPADTITYGRLILTGGVAALVADAATGSVHHVVLTGLAAVSLMFDAADGQVARRTGATSRFGARFDMEADSVLALVLSVYIAIHLGWWAVLMGLFRYAFIVAGWALPWLNAPLPPRMSRKVVAASQGVVLVVVSAGLLPTAVAQICVAVSLISLCWSFAVDIRWLWLQESSRRRLPAPSRAFAGAGHSEPVLADPVSDLLVVKPATT
ncbi:CDP-alcohol phosphatidyltransferase family protein [Actinoplanes sp. NPDC051494]|uniref:CDP-alcohol phosphatidyltransferase family protein n=1 Tax=Actinoplanes sp. NPDC051494 TaxID=3363907 RepID=UPI00379B80B2